MRVDSGADSELVVITSPEWKGIPCQRPTGRLCVRVYPLYHHASIGLFGLFSTRRLANEKELRSDVDRLEKALQRETGARLKAARLANKMNQREVGRALRPPKSRQAVSRLEQGAEPTVSVLRQLAMLYGESLDWLALGIKTEPIGSASLHEIFREREAAEADWPGGL
jgi:transcriptional regulator with XRE-family HTH domain